MDAGQRKADELKLKGVLAELRGFVRAVEKGEEWYVTVKHRETHIDRVIYRPTYETAVTTLRKVSDEKLIREAERILEKANKGAKKSLEDKRVAFDLGFHSSKIIRALTTLTYIDILIHF